MQLAQKSEILPHWPGSCGLQVAGAQIFADPSGAMFFPAYDLLAVADLHLEKGSAYAARGVFLPPYDTAATLVRLAAAIARFAPRLVVALGDSFHDGRAAARMEAGDTARLRAMQAGRDWIWIAGNHDPVAPENLGGEAHSEWRAGPITFRHEPQPGVACGEIAGHLHPVARVATRNGALRRRCFAGDGERLVLPAFGAFAGGLNVRDAAFDGLFGRALGVHVLGRERVFAVRAGNCVREG